MPANIMIVEDEFIIQHELKNTLEKMDHQVIALASKGEEAVLKAEQTGPEIILMDINLKSEMDGIEAAEEITRRLEIPIIFITAFSDDERVNRAKQFLPYGYLIKPVQERDLKIAIELALHTAKINNEKKAAELEREKTIIELEDALKKIRVLEGLVPICASCKKIRDDRGYWNQIETYIEDHSNALFSHGICPECANKIYKHTAWYGKVQNTKAYQPQQPETKATILVWLMTTRPVFIS